MTKNHYIILKDYDIISGTFTFIAKQYNRDLKSSHLEIMNATWNGLCNFNHKSKFYDFLSKDDVSQKHYELNNYHVVDASHNFKQQLKSFAYHVAKQMVDFTFRS